MTWYPIFVTGRGKTKDDGPSTPAIRSFSRSPTVQGGEFTRINLLFSLSLSLSTPVRPSVAVPCLACPPLWLATTELGRVASGNLTGQRRYTSAGTGTYLCCPGT